MERVHPVSLAYQHTGFYPVSLGLLSLVFLMGALRTNVVFVMIFVSATTAFGFACGSLFYTAIGRAEIANTCLIGVGAGFFVADILGWYLFIGMMIQIMDLPIPSPPVFDLSTVIKGKSQRVKQE